MKKKLRYKFGVILLHDGVERFYWPGDMVDVQLEELSPMNSMNRQLWLRVDHQEKAKPKGEGRTVIPYMKL